MSGHSHYATIKRQKESKDAARGNIFSKLTRAIQIAVKTGGGADPDSNSKLRVVMEKAGAANMPKENIERAILKASSEAENVEEATYEGFGPSGVSIIVVTATDNRNRTGQELKNLFERAGGSLAGPGAVSFNFENKGFMLVQKTADPESQILTLIDLGVEEVEETEDGIEVYVSPDKLSQMRKKVEEAGFIISSTELYMKPKVLQTVSDSSEAKRAIAFLDSLNEHDDVQKVYANLDVPSEVLSQISS